MPVIHILICMFTHSVHVTSNVITLVDVRLCNAEQGYVITFDVRGHPEISGLTNKLPELVYKQLLSIPVISITCKKLCHVHLACISPVIVAF